MQNDSRKCEIKVVKLDHFQLFCGLSFGVTEGSSEGRGGGNPIVLITPSPTTALQTGFHCYPHTIQQPCHLPHRNSDLHQYNKEIQSSFL